MSCLIGGAIGDALGAPIEFMNMNEIVSQYGENGICDYVEYPDGLGEFTDDTQMTLFTAEGILKDFQNFRKNNFQEFNFVNIYNSYQKWLFTQGFNANYFINNPTNYIDGWLINRKELFKFRAPGNTCISSLENAKIGTISNPINNSKGCGGVMRVAPVGLFFSEDFKLAFKIGAEIAAITHGHPSGYLPAGVFSAIISLLTQGKNLKMAIENAIELLKTYKQNNETLIAIQKSINLYHNSNSSESVSYIYKKIESIGAGWTGEEAIAISLFCSLLFEDNFEKGVIVSVNHSGDSDSTGSITGNLLGLINGIDSIPIKWINNLKYKDIIEKIAVEIELANN